MERLLQLETGETYCADIKPPITPVFPGGRTSQIYHSTTWASMCCIMMEGFENYPQKNDHRKEMVYGSLLLEDSENAYAHPCRWFDSCIVECKVSNPNDSNLRQWISPSGSSKAWGCDKLNMQPHAIIFRRNMRDNRVLPKRPATPAEMEAAASAAEESDSAAALPRRDAPELRRSASQLDTGGASQRDASQSSRELPLTSADEVGLGQVSLFGGRHHVVKQITVRCYEVFTPTEQLLPPPPPPPRNPVPPPPPSEPVLAEHLLNGAKCKSVGMRPLQAQAPNMGQASSSRTSRNLQKPPPAVVMPPPAVVMPPPQGGLPLQAQPSPRVIPPRFRALAASANSSIAATSLCWPKMNPPPRPG